MHLTVGATTIEKRRQVRARRRARRWPIALGLLLLGVAAIAAAALLAWPHAHVSSSEDALARLDVPTFAGTVTAIHAHDAEGKRVPLRLKHGELWPSAKLSPAEHVTVDVTVKRPGWAGWLVGHTDERQLTVTTPAAPVLLGRWLQVRSGAPVTIGFDEPVRAVAFGRGPVKPLSAPSRRVPVGVVASGSHVTGKIAVAAAARSWETLTVPVRVTWFPARPYPQVLVEPAPSTHLVPSRPLTITFSEPVRNVLGTGLPTVQPATPGRWRRVDAHTLTFVPGRLGFALGSSVQVALPRAVHVVRSNGAELTRTLDWSVPPGSMLRLQQLLAQAGYLPLDWQASAAEPSSPQAELAAAISPPAGRFVWRYPNIPPELSAQWQPGELNEITRGAVMAFQKDHALQVDAIAGPHVWHALLADALAGVRKTDGYSYVFVHRNLPQSLNLWHDGSVILSSPGNTGVPAAPTQLGTYPVFEHIPSGTMSGTNPDGSHYNDPGIRYISYFHGGDAIHAFNRASFGTPQSLGCVELPLDAAATVWPYTPIGTLVTIED
jgi:peptidoglycan hydrolase-like protein with peptidoglycan-binding domain